MDQHQQAYEHLVEEQGVPQQQLTDGDDPLNRKPYHDEVPMITRGPPQTNSLPLVTIPNVSPSMVITEPVPPDHLPLAIFTTICCFWPLGIFAILRARDVHKKAWQGNMEGAREASRRSRLFSLIALVIGISIHVVCIIVIIISITRNIQFAKDAANLYTPNDSSDEDTQSSWN
ncbi:proline-rich transmembrane protein 1-like [Saccoglossus kowalevskii]|uniref:Proline-rich transmembrane protein 1-like n=1 Tax=Saccoglossus kowalevskii TaxID=10224 RepID=A0ABM0GWL6_SACKO|nr:PREDICTED: proline-rich transmembrane protein 1-like [Saccoglossus kowalevskii]